MSAPANNNIRPQRRNANKHTERGMSALEKSIQKHGWMGAVTTAADLEAFGGSARIEVAASQGMLDDPIIVESDGKRPVVVVRTDIPTADDPRARALAVAENRVAELNLDYDLAILKDDFDLLDGLFTQPELDALLNELIGGADTPENQYSRNIKSPLYTPHGPKPQVSELCDDTKMLALMRTVSQAELPEDERSFLLLAAARHCVFRYDRIAEYYAHSEAAVQRLMEESALVIIDFQRAIELGFVRLVERIAGLYAEDYPTEGVNEPQNGAGEL